MVQASQTSLVASSVPITSSVLGVLYFGIKSRQGGEGTEDSCPVQAAHRKMPFGNGTRHIQHIIVTMGVFS